MHQTDADRKILAEKGGVPIGIGKDCHIKRAIIDKNARIGDNVKVYFLFLSNTFFNILVICLGKSQSPGLCKEYDLDQSLGFSEPSTILVVKWTNYLCKVDSSIFSATVRLVGHELDTTSVGKCIVRPV